MQLRFEQATTASAMRSRARKKAFQLIHVGKWQGKSEEQLWGLRRM